ncbi:MAG: alpha/beta fold hydrolase [Cyanobacteriota bacterium]
MEIKEESIFIEVSKDEKLHLKRIYSDSNGKVAFLLHGAIENGKIFYSDSGKGLAFFLAKNGFDVYIPDLSGRGKSIPKSSKESTFGQNDYIIRDIPSFLDKIIEIRGQSPHVWISHSWGGVLLSSYFVRFSKYRELVKCMLFFATKRKVSVINFQRFIYIDLVWKTLCPLLIKKYGFLPAKEFKIGADNESKDSYYESVFWVKQNKWIDMKDNFDYGEEAKKIKFPPVISITGIKDKSLGHYSDVFDFLLEIIPDYPDYKTESSFIVLSKKNGYLQDYDHINILTHKDCIKDHFPKMIEKINKFF